VRVAEVGSFWAELDYIEDYERILAHLRRPVAAALGASAA
jgi:hypothetical protein